MLQTISEYSHMIGLYCYMALFVWLFNAFLAGYNGTAPSREDFFQSVLWPISIVVLLGITIKIIVQSITKNK